MKIRVALAILVVLAFTITTAYAAPTTTIRISGGNYVDLGWKKTLKTGPEAGQAVDFKSRGDTVPAGVEGIEISPKKSESNNLAWAGLSAQLFEGRWINEITALRIRTNGFEGDGGSWEPPSLYLGLTNVAGTGNRSLRALPYATFGRGTSWTYYEYDLLNPNTKWLCYIDAVVYTGFAGVQATWGNLRFAPASLIGTSLPSGQNFNVFNGAALNQEIAYGSSARGMVDWVEIGFAGGEVVRYDFVVPEPGTLAALATGLIGFIGLRRRF